jgi:DNA repair exonuclease SbcCD nuclease subunit
MHSTTRNLKDSKALIDFIIKTAKEHDVDRVEFLGDLFHTHAVKRLEVEDFWLQAFKDITSAGFPVVTLVGNHDQCGSKELELLNSLNVFSLMTSVTIVNTPQIINDIGYIPYMNNHEKFLKACHELYKQGAKQTLIAHQTFTGAVYENGFYDENGIDPALVPQSEIISGHVHCSQQIGKCFYPGTPKWDSISDANENKGIWIFKYANEGSIKSKEFISTDKVVTPIKKHTLQEGDVLPELNQLDRNYVELIGKTSWINTVKKKYKGFAQIKARPTDRKVNVIDRDKTMSLTVFLQKYFEPINGVLKDDIDTYINRVLNDR